MRKIQVVQLIGIVLFVTYIALIATDIIFNYLRDYKVLILSSVLAIISLNLISKGVLLKSSSTLWFAITLLLMAIIIVIMHLMDIMPGKYYFIFAIVPIFSSIINLAIFHNLIYIKVIILNVSILIPILIIYFLDLSIWIYWLITIISILLGIVICRSWNLVKENE